MHGRISMAGIRMASDERWLSGGLAVAVWAGALAGIGLLFSGGGYRPDVRTATIAPAPDVDPVATLPPTLVVAGRADVNGSDCVHVAGGASAGPGCAAGRQR